MINDKFEPIIIAFFCQWSVNGAIDMAGKIRMEYPVNIRVIKVPCSGRVNPLHILQAFMNGADGVIIAGCLEGGCHYINGNLRAKHRVEQLKELLNITGLNGERLEMYLIGFCNSNKLINYMKDFVERIRKLGPNPLKSKGRSIP